MTNLAGPRGFPSAVGRAAPNQTPALPAGPGRPARVAAHAAQQQVDFELPERPRRKRRKHASALMAWLFLTPALILLLYFKIVPLLQGAQMSLYNVRPYLGDLYVGTANYRTVTTDPQFTKVIWQTVVLAIGTTGGSLVIGFGLALLVEGQARHLWLVRTAAFLPVVTTMAVVAEVWRVMYYPSKGGLLNSIIGLIGIGPQQYLANGTEALPSVILVGIWRGAPYDMMIFLAGLATVNRSLYESAAVDGANRWRRFVHVTIPALRPVFTILFVLAALRGLRSFTEVFLLTNGAPNGNTEVLMTLIYKLGLEQGHLGVATAGSMVLFVATAAITIAVNSWRRRVRAA
jgi:multiple sugar transport system permease protein